MAGPTTFMKELRRRNVFRVAIAYTIVSWLLIQVAATMLPVFKAPEWIMQVFTFLLVLGFPVAIIFAWAFELTPQGLKREHDVDRSESTTSHTGRKLDFVIIAILSAAIVFFVLDKFVWIESARQVAPATSAADMKSVAVLPFENMSGDETNNPFTIGVHDDLLTQLSKIASIKTISRTSVSQYQGTTKPISEIASELGVATILEGGVQRSGDSVRINVQLIDARSDAHLWAETYDRQLTAANIFAIQSDIANAISAALRATLSPEERASIDNIPTESLEAYETYQLGRQALARITTSSAARAIELFERSTAIDPEFAQAWAGLADGYLKFAALSGRDVDELTRKALAAATRAIGIDDQLSEPHTALATILENEGDFPAAIETIQQALAINPNDARARSRYASILHVTGNLEQSLLEMEKAVRLDPLSASINDAYAFTLSEVGRFDEALARYRIVDEIDPNFPMASVSIGTIYGLAYGRLDIANLWYRKALAADPGNPWLSAILGLVYIELNDDQRAEYWIDRALRQAPAFPWANGAMMMLQSYRGDAAEVRHFADKVMSVSSQWRQGTAHSHGRVPDVRAGLYTPVLERFEAAYPELFADSPDVTGANYRSAIDIAGLYLLLGDTDRASALLAQCEQQISGMIRVGFYGYWVSDVQILALQGKTNEALAALRQAIDQGWVTDWRYFFYVDPSLDSIRDEPDFQAMSQEIKEEMAAQLARTREMEANGELAEIPAEDD
jgi:TolB-like protein/tetratricopeptide (TPR) repeat protein